MQDLHLHKRHNAKVYFSFDGCEVSATSSQDVSDAPLNAIRDILLSAYKPRQTGGILEPNNAKWDNIGRSNRLLEP